MRGRSFDVRHVTCLYVKHWRCDLPVGSPPRQCNVPGPRCAPLRTEGIIFRGWRFARARDGLARWPSWDKRAAQRRCTFLMATIRTPVAIRRRPPGRSAVRAFCMACYSRRPAPARRTCTNARMRARSNIRTSLARTVTWSSRLRRTAAKRARIGHGPTCAPAPTKRRRTPPPPPSGPTKGHPARSRPPHREAASASRQASMAVEREPDLQRDETVRERPTFAPTSRVRSINAARLLIGTQRRQRTAVHNSIVEADGIVSRRIDRRARGPEVEGELGHVVDDVAIRY